MEIIYGDALDKALEGPEKSRRGKPSKTIYEVINDKYFIQSGIDLPK